MHAGPLFFALRQPERLPVLYLLMAKGTQNHPHVALHGFRDCSSLIGRRKIESFLPPDRALGSTPELFPRNTKMRRKFTHIICAYKRIPALRKTRKRKVLSGIRAPGTVCLQTRAVARRHDERRLSAIFRTPGGFCAAFCRFKKRQESATETVACLVVFLPQKTVQSISRINKWRRKMEYLLFFRRVKFKREDRVVLPLKFYHVKIL